MGEVIKTGLEIELEKAIEERNYFLLEITPEAFKKKMEMFLESKPVPLEGPSDKGEFSVDKLSDWKNARKKQDIEKLREWEKNLSGPDFIDFIMYCVCKGTGGESIQPARQRIAQIGEYIIRYTFDYQTSLGYSRIPDVETPCSQRINIMRFDLPFGLMYFLFSDNVMDSMNFFDEEVKEKYLSRHKVFEKYELKKEVNIKQFVNDLMYLVGV